MTLKIIHKHSQALSGGVADPPVNTDLEDGELGINFASADPALFIVDSANTVRRISGQPNSKYQLANDDANLVGADATTAINAALVAANEITSADVLIVSDQVEVTNSGNPDANEHVSAGRYFFDGAIWFGASSGGGSVTISDTAPINPNQGDMWWDSAETSALYIWYEDSDSSQWVPATPQGGGGGGGASVSVGENPPGAPALGDLWWDSSSPDVGGGRLYIWFIDEDGTEQWVDASPGGGGGGGGGGAQEITISDDPPAGAENGHLWWDSSSADGGRLYVFYNDGDTSQWVEASPQKEADQYWTRDGTTLSPTTAGDNINVGGSGTFDGAVICLGDPTDGATNGTRLGSTVQCAAPSAVNAVWHGFVVGTAAPTSTIKANGETEFVGQANTSHTWYTNTTVRFSINDNGSFLRTCTTTSNGANAHVWTGSTPENLLMRSTSSMRYKTSVEPINISYSKKLLDIQPIWFRSLSENDPDDYSYWGFSAEEVASVDPRLAFYMPDPSNEGQEIPDGVQYDRFVPHLLNLIKEQITRIEALEETNASLEERLTTLEGGTN